MESLIAAVFAPVSCIVELHGATLLGILVSIIFTAEPINFGE